MRRLERVGETFIVKGAVSSEAHQGVRVHDDASPESPTPVSTDSDPPSNQPLTLDEPSFMQTLNLWAQSEALLVAPSHPVGRIVSQSQSWQPATSSPSRAHARPSDFVPSDRRLSQSRRGVMSSVESRAFHPVLFVLCFCSSCEKRENLPSVVQHTHTHTHGVPPGGVTLAEASPSTLLDQERDEQSPAGVR